MCGVLNLVMCLTSLSRLEQGGPNLFYFHGKRCEHVIHCIMDKKLELGGTQGCTGAASREPSIRCLAESNGHVAILKISRFSQK